MVQSIDGSGKLTEVKTVEDLDKAVADGRPIWNIGDVYLLNKTYLKLRKVNRKDLVFRPLSKEEIAEVYQRTAEELEPPPPSQIVVP